MKVVVNRLVSSCDSTLGVWTVHDGLDLIYACKSLELPWKDNKTNISCIPCGTYLVNSRYSLAHKTHFILEGVEGRDYILAHVANYIRELRGCIAVGRVHSDIDMDGKLDVTNSRDTLDELIEILPESFYLTII